MSSLCSKELAAVLFVLKERRDELCRGFIEKSQDIYYPSYKYENSPKLMQIARERYFMIWIGSFWSEFQDYLDKNFSPEAHEKTEEIFAAAYMELLSKWGLAANLGCGQIELGMSLIKDINVALEGFINAAENSEALKNTLALAMEKNRALFDRKLKDLEKGWL